MPRSADRVQADSSKVAYAESSDGASTLGQNPPELDTELIKVWKVRDIDPRFEKWKNIQRPATDVVLLTVKEIEFLSCYAYLTNVFSSHFTSLGTVYFGEIQSDDDKKVKVALIRCSEGAAGAQGAINAVSNAVVALEPKAVICAGYCGGLNESKAKLGDVVISRKIATYAKVKVTDAGQEKRGVIANVSRLMSPLITSAAYGWKPPLKNPNLTPNVCGDKEMLSGPQLVDDKERRDELLKDFPQAIAIEMEGEGVYAAAYNLQIEWVVIKGISDYADGSKDSTSDWRPFASAMAASLIHNMLKKPEVLNGWPHYKKLDNA